MSYHLVWDGSQLAQNHPQRIHVAHLPSGASFRVFQLRCGISGRSAFHLEDSPGVRVGQAEIDQLHMPAVAGDHDIGRLQIAVRDLVAMQIFYGVQQLFGYGLGHFRAELTAIKQICQILSLHILHFDAIPELLQFGEGVTASYPWMVQIPADFKLFAQQLLIQEVAAILFLKAFENPPLSVTDAAPYFTPPAGPVDTLESICLWHKLPWLEKTGNRIHLISVISYWESRSHAFPIKDTKQFWKIGYPICFSHSSGLLNWARSDFNVGISPTQSATVRH